MLRASNHPNMKGPYQLMSIYHTVYKTTNLVNNKIYIGVHSTKNPNDSYLGSGVALKRAIEKHGKENFTKEVLFIFESKQEAFAKETELVTDEFRSRDDTYNMDTGGHHGPSLPGYLNPMFGRNHTAEAKNLISVKNKGKTGGIRSEYHRQRIRETNSNRILSNESKERLRRAAQENIKKAIKAAQNPEALAKRAKNCSKTKLSKRDLEPKRKWFHKDHGTILANCQDIVRLDPSTKWSSLREIIIGRYSNHKGWFICH